MRTSQFVVLALVVLGISAAELMNPVPCSGNDNGAVGVAGQGSCSAAISGQIAMISFEQAIEAISSVHSIMTFGQLAQHVIQNSKEALGYEAILSDETLANLAWIFRLRHMPEPVVVNEKTTTYDFARVVRHVLTNDSVRAEHRFSEAKITELINAVKESVETGRGFVFRMIEPTASEFEQMSLHKLETRMHVFAAVHTSTDLMISFYSASLTGEFIKGHGGINAIEERDRAAKFSRQWLLNQWVNLWVCTNPGTN